VLPVSQVVHPVYVFPPHCPYFATGVHVVGGDDGAETALVTRVVGTDTGGSGLVGAVDPLPLQTAGPGIGYVVAVMAAVESMLKLMPGSEAEYAPGKETRKEEAGDAVPEPVTVSWAHSG